MPRIRGPYVDPLDNAPAGSYLFQLPNGSTVVTYPDGSQRQWFGSGRNIPYEQFPADPPAPSHPFDNDYGQPGDLDYRGRQLDRRLDDLADGQDNPENDRWVWERYLGGDGSKHFTDTEET